MGTIPAVFEFDGAEIVGYVASALVVLSLTMTSVVRLRTISLAGSIVFVVYGILIESALSYLGVGVQPPTPSWGAILNEGKEFLALAPWVSLFPGGFIMVAVLSFNVIGDGLRDAFDPRAEMR